MILRENFPTFFDRDQYFSGKTILGGGIPLLDLIVTKEGTQTILEEDFELFSLPHGHTNTLGVRHRKMAWITDCREIPAEIVKKLSDIHLELLFIDCLRPEPHQTHLHLDLTLKYISEIKPKLAVLIHMGHEWDYLTLQAELLKRGVKNTFPATDGQHFLYS